MNSSVILEGREEGREHIWKHILTLDPWCYNSSFTFPNPPYRYSITLSLSSLKSKNRNKNKLFGEWPGESSCWVLSPALTLSPNVAVCIFNSTKGRIKMLPPGFMEQSTRVSEWARDSISKEKRWLYWLVLCQLGTGGVITEKGASVKEMPPWDTTVRYFLN